MVPSVPSDAYSQAIEEAERLADEATGIYADISPTEEVDEENAAI
jgi:hypothetical protein